MDSPITDGVRIYGDSVALTRFLQREIESLLYEPFSDTDIPVISATFQRDGSPPDSCSEIVQSGTDDFFPRRFCGAFSQRSKS